MVVKYKIDSIIEELLVLEKDGRINVWIWYCCKSIPINTIIFNINFSISFLIFSLDFIMSVDKFGRFSSCNTISKGVRGAKGEGFNLSRAGDYDIKYMRIFNVGNPTEIGDSVNLDTLKFLCLNVHL